MALAGLTGGRLSMSEHIPPAHKQIRPFSSGSPRPQAERCRGSCRSPTDVPFTMRCSRRAAGLRSLRWPPVGLAAGPLLVGGKVQAPPGFADHVVFRDRGCALPASRRPASPCAPARLLRWAITARPPSSARSALTAAHACGTAANRPTASIEHRVPRRLGRAAFGGKLSNSEQLN